MAEQNVGIEEPARTTTILTIPRMTLDLFEFWFNHDIFEIGRNIHISLPIIEAGIDKWAPYVRVRFIRWSADDPKHFNRTTIISWAQIHTDEIRVEIKSEGELLGNIKFWLAHRLEVTEMLEGEATLNYVPEQKLTPTETKVASYLAEKLSYEQIAVRLGGKSLAAAKKHAQNLAKKWHTRQVIEVLWDEAIKRGYGTPQ